MRGEILSGCLYAGTGVARITELRSAAALVTELWRDAPASGLAAQ